jgi:hypothetical protein
VRGLVGKQGLHGKVQRFGQFSGRTGSEISALETIHEDLETERLASLEESTGAGQEDNSKVSRLGD